MRGLAVGVLSWLLVATAFGEPVRLRVVASNLTSGNQQSYSPDNGNHSNPEGAGARILKALKPDVVLMQEFNTTMPARQWVNATFGMNYSYFIEVNAQIPNGIVSRYPIVSSGEWHDSLMPNRDFAWAKIALPNRRFLWAISVHLYSKKPTVRAKQAEALVALVREHIPEEDLVVLGGDFNAANDAEPCLEVFSRVFDTKSTLPVDQAGDRDTNATRKRPLDWVLADSDLSVYERPVRIGAVEFPHGLVFDSRVFKPLADVAPVQAADSAAPNMQHMAVVRDFVVP